MGGVYSCGLGEAVNGDLLFTDMLATVINLTGSVRFCGFFYLSLFAQGENPDFMVNWINGDEFC